MQFQTNLHLRDASPCPHAGASSISHQNLLRRAFTRCLLFLLVFQVQAVFAQAPSSIIPDLSKFKLTFPLDANGDDYAGVSYGNRNNPLIKAWERDNLVNWTAPGSTSNRSTYRYYFFTSGSEVVFRAHCAGALTSANSYPRSELRETPNGGDNYWSFNDEQELNARFRITRVPNEKREVCVIQIKGRVGSESADEALRVDYRQDGSQGLHIVWNENNTINDVMDYSVGNTIVAKVTVDNKRVTVNLNNVNVSGSRGRYTYSYNVPYNTGYFKAGCYTQSSIWSEKTGQDDESPNAYAEVRFTSLSLGGGSSGSTCVATVPGNRRVTNVGNTSATLDWSDVANFDHYKCRYRRVGTSSWTTSGSLRSSSSWSISGLYNNTQYQWQVRSKCSDGSASNYTAGPNFTTGGSGGGANPVVTMRKRNAMSYGLDGGNGGANNRTIYLYNYNANNVNQQWIEIDRGNGYYTYQKKNTNYCIDGGNGGARRNPVKLYTCGSGNQNQHWRKVSMGSGYFRLEKRNSSSYSIDGKGGGTNGQTAHLWSNNNNNQNQHWYFTTVGSSNRAAANDGPDLMAARVTDIDGSTEEHLSFWPNPSDGDLTVLIPAGDPTHTSSVVVSDLLGRTVFQRTGLQAGESFQISEPLSTGTYILRWMAEDGKLLQVDKLIRR